MKRAIIIILDGCGIGELPDAHLYGDHGSHTLGNIARAVDGMNLPNLEKLGLGKIDYIKGIRSELEPVGAFGKMAEVSPGKDSTTGHWELAGLILDRPFPTYANGFPEDILAEFTRRTGLECLGNYPASGTEIIKELGEEHLKTGKPIIYTSADSVFQIAAHEEVFPLSELYRLCEIARGILHGEHAVARVIARPFIGSSAGNFKRTVSRKDFSLKPFRKIILDILQESGIPTCGIGKIYDLYGGTGLTRNIKTRDNKQGMMSIIEAIDEQNSGLIMANLVDFDMLWGHRNNPDAFYVGLKEFDHWLPDVLKRISQEDILFITADHGNDPTTPGTDHSREYVPILCYGETVKAGTNIGTRVSFADLQATLAEVFDVPSTGDGDSFADLIFKN